MTSDPYFQIAVNNGNGNYRETSAYSCASQSWKVPTEAGGRQLSSNLLIFIIDWKDATVR